MDKKNIEQQLADTLNEEEIKKNNLELDAIRQLSPKYEIRHIAKHDPIVEETKIIRSIAKEVDDRYDEYMSRVNPKDK